jgi:hypothetical protein
MKGLFCCTFTCPRVETFTTAGLTRFTMGAREGTAWPATAGGGMCAKLGRARPKEAAKTAAKARRFIVRFLIGWTI